MEIFVLRLCFRVVSGERKKSNAGGPKGKVVAWVSSWAPNYENEKTEKILAKKRNPKAETKENERDLPEMRLEEHVQVETQEFSFSFSFSFFLFLTFFPFLSIFLSHPRPCAWKSSLRKFSPKSPAYKHNDHESSHSTPCRSITTHHYNRLFIHNPGNNSQTHSKHLREKRRKLRATERKCSKLFRRKIFSSTSSSVPWSEISALLQSSIRTTQGLERRKKIVEKKTSSYHCWDEKKW